MIFSSYLREIPENNWRCVYEHLDIIGVPVLFSSPKVNAVMSSPNRAGAMKSVHDTVRENHRKN
jgi:hypothetical protein